MSNRDEGGGAPRFHGETSFVGSDGEATLRLDPILLGRGSAGQALRHAMALYPEEIGPPRQWPRGKALPPADPERSLLVVAHPHGLHASCLLEAAELGYRYAICEKPAAVDLEQVKQLESLPMKVWICHGYRLLWGPEQLRQAISSGEFGKIVTLEGRYWQSSATRTRKALDWKDDIELAGSHDVLLDLATHWVDLMIFLTGRPPRRAWVDRWYVNAASAHRDTHVHVRLDHDQVISFGSVSKTAHGAGNLLEVHVLGESARASWSFADPDVILWSQGSETRSQVRIERQPPARLAPFHGLGWMEGYARLVGDVVGHLGYGRPSLGPSLEEHLVVLRTLLESV